MTSDAVLGVEEIYHLAKQDQGLNPTQRVAAIRQMFENGQLTTHDDATLMVIGKLSLPSHSDIKTSAKRPSEGGLGLKLVSRLTDTVTFSHDAGNQVALKYNYHQKSQQ